MTTQYIILDNMDPVGSPYMIDLDGVVWFLKGFYDTDAITVYAVDIEAGTSSNVSGEVAQHWYENHVDFVAIDDADDLPDFIRNEIGDAAISVAIHAANNELSELMADWQEAVL